MLRSGQVIVESDLIVAYRVVEQNDDKSLMREAYQNLSADSTACPIATKNGT